MPPAITTHAIAIITATTKPLIAAADCEATRPLGSDLADGDVAISGLAVLASV